jgi:hypothetical protein
VHVPLFSGCSTVHDYRLLSDCLFLQSDVYNLAAGLLETANNGRKINCVFLRVKRGHCVG